MNEHQSEIPDFSGPDDFINDKEVQKARKAAEAHKQMVDDSITILKNELGLQKSSHKNLKTFHMFKNLQAAIIESYQSSIFSSKLIVSIAEYGSSYPVPRNQNAGTDEYLFGYMELSKEYPSTYICREAIQQKVINLFVKNDVDFTDHKKFSWKFNVVTKDSKRLEDLFRLKNLDQLIIFPEMEVEIHGHDCLFRNGRRPVSPEEVTQFSTLTKMLSRILS